MNPGVNGLNLERLAELALRLGPEKLERLATIAIENEIHFNGVPTQLTILSFDVTKSAKLEDILDHQGYSYDKLLGALKERWKKVYEYYHGMRVKYVGDEVIVAFGLSEKSKARQEELAARCAVDLHKVIEHETFDFIADGISRKLEIPNELVYKYLTTRKREWESDREKLQWIDVYKEYKIMQGMIGGKFQIRIGIASGRATPKTGEGTERDVDREAINKVHRVYSYAAPGQTIVPEDVLNRIKSFVYFEKTHDYVKLKEFEGPLFAITGIKRYDTPDLAGLSPVGSNWHSRLGHFRNLTRDTLRLLEHYQQGEATIAGKHYEYDEMNLILDSDIYERSNIYYADNSLLLTNLCYALADAMVQQGTLSKELYDTYLDHLGFTALLLDLGLWQSSERVFGKFMDSPRLLSADQNDRTKLRKARHDAVDAAYCDPLMEHYHIDSFVRFQHARYDGTGETSTSYRHRAGFATNLDPLFKETLKGDDIPFVIRIAKVARSVVEYFSDRANKLRPKFAEELKDPYELTNIVLSHIKEDEGARYDPKVVRALEYLLQPANAPGPAIAKPIKV